MKFEKLDTNKIKITLTLRDLEEKHIDLHSFMSRSLETQDLFEDILTQAEKEIGFITNNYDIHIEGFATSNGTFIFTITRTSQNNILKKKKLTYKRKSPQNNTGLSVYSFNSFNDYCNFCNFLGSISTYYLGYSCLIRYNSNYYLILDSIKMNSINSKTFFTCLSEFALHCMPSVFLANILLEHGEKIIPEKAIEIGINYLN